MKTTDAYKNYKIELSKIVGDLHNATENQMLVPTKYGIVVVQKRDETYVGADSFDNVNSIRMMYVNNDTLFTRYWSFDFAWRTLFSLAQSFADFAYHNPDKITESIF